MSPEHDVSAHPRSEDDRVDSRAVLLVGVGALVVFAIAAAAASGWLRLKSGERPPLPLPPELGATKIGLVEQTLFGLPLRGEKDRAARAARLESWGWVDQANGIAHIPIETAMTLAAQGVRAAPTEPSVAPPLGASHGGVDAPSVPIRPPAPAAPAKGGTR
ncbi:MAG TPA: hypothetical protein VFP50_14230 [Anaeromyxobacteraceae bacterium]|nr:hypothetical protein [Anaeromyxobacteraceae bacterium]